MQEALEHLWEDMEYPLDKLVDEFLSGKYKKLTDCPTCGIVKAYCKAYNFLINHFHIPGTPENKVCCISLKSVVEDCLYRRDMFADIISKDLSDLRGKIQFADDYDYKKLRNEDRAEEGAR